VADVVESYKSEGKPLPEPRDVVAAWFAYAGDRGTARGALLLNFSHFRLLSFPSPSMTDQRERKTAESNANEAPWMHLAMDQCALDGIENVIESLS
jgi:hypothetical protein